jgi:hypothetical protein
VLHGRLPRVYLRSGDGLPGRHQIRGGWSTGLGNSLGSVSETNEVVNPMAISVATAESDEVALPPRTAPSAAIGGLVGGPLLDLRAKPDFHAALTEVDHRSGHVGIPVLVDADCIGMGEVQKLCHAMRVEEIIQGDPTSHGAQITSLVGSVRPAI